MQWNEKENHAAKNKNLKLVWNNTSIKIIKDKIKRENSNYFY